MANVKLTQINKIYDQGVHAVHDFNLDIKSKEFVVFVGPSGCGKSTTLRMIAGLEEITSGDLFIDDKLVNNLAPKDRDIAMVFQSYALYPQMTVAENMAYSLKLKKIPKEEIKVRVEETAKILGLTPYLETKPRHLSGGQRQRVALGRAIIRKPKVFLMDEPLSNLDAKLRIIMRSEIIKIHNEVGATTVYVTHDQVEAMTMADRIVVMKDGFTQQIGTPIEVYEKPSNMFVASFIGSPATNFLYGKITDKNTFLSNDGIEISLNKEQIKLLKNYVGKDIVYGIKPEHIHYSIKDEYSDVSSSNLFEAKVEMVEQLGDIINAHSRINNTSLIFKTSALTRLKSSQNVQLSIDTEFSHFFNKSTTKRICEDYNTYEEAAIDIEKKPELEEKTKIIDKITNLFKKNKK